MDIFFCLILMRILTTAPLSKWFNFWLCHFSGHNLKEVSPWCPRQGTYNPLRLHHVRCVTQSITMLFTVGTLGNVLVTHFHQTQCMRCNCWLLYLGAKTCSQWFFLAHQAWPCNLGKVGSLNGPTMALCAISVLLYYCDSLRSGLID